MNNAKRYALERRSGSPRGSRGLTLMEILVALVVLSIGMLGIGALQLVSMRGNNNAFWHAQATWSLYDMSDRIRANRDGATAGDYDAATTVGAAAIDCETVACTAAQMAAHDVAEWGQALQGIPAAQGNVVNNGDGTFTVTVLWDERLSGATGTGCDPTNANDLTCASVMVTP